MRLLTSRRAVRPSRRRPPLRLRLESLEGRVLLNAATLDAMIGNAGKLANTMSVAAGSTATPAEPTIAAVRGGPSSVVFLVTTDHALLRYDGTTWTQIGAPG